VSVFGSVIVAAAVIWAASSVVRALKGLQEEVTRARQAHLLGFLAPALEEVRSEPAALLAWRRAADLTRSLFPEDAAALDRAAGERYPFTASDIQDAHARWTSNWLAWERSHAVEFKARGAALQTEAARNGEGAPRARLDALEQEKLDLYQRRYAEYVRISKALQALLEESSRSAAASA
jgi:hypothetical protein